MKLKLLGRVQIAATPIKLLAIVAVVAVAGASLNHLTYAATGSLTLSPNSGSYNVGSSFNVILTENSGTDQALSVDALISFPSDKLTFTGDTTVGPFTSNPGGTDTATNGSLEVFRGNLSGSLTTGSQTVTVLS